MKKRLLATAFATLMFGSLAVVNAGPASAEPMYRNQCGMATCAIYRSTDGGSTWVYVMSYVRTQPQ